MTALNEFDALKAQINIFVSPTTTLTVTDSASNAVAAGVLKTVKEFEKQIELRRVAAVSPLNDRVKEINAYAREISSPLAAVETEIKGKMLEFSTSERIRRIEEEKRIADEYRKKEQEARAHAEKIAAEARAKQDAEAKALREKEQADIKAFERKVKEEQDALRMFGIDPAEELARAEREAKELQEKQFAATLEWERKAKEKDELERARHDQEQLERSMEAERQLKSLEASRPKNVRKVKKYEIVDASFLPREYLIPNTSMIQKAVTCGAPSIPGVRIWEEEIVVSR